MSTKPAPIAPEWLTPGAEVLVVRGHRDESVTKTTVAKVHKRYFTVTYRAFADLRFSLDRQEHRESGLWSPTTFVVPLDSDRARATLEAVRRRDLVSAARSACDSWLRNQSRESRLAAIEALQAIEPGGGDEHQ